MRNWQCRRGRFIWGYTMNVMNWESDPNVQGPNPVSEPEAVIALCTSFSELWITLTFHSPCFYPATFSDWVALAWASGPLGMWLVMGTYCRPYLTISLCFKLWSMAAGKDCKYKFLQPPWLWNPDFLIPLVLVWVVKDV